jgi:hypothetical protein
MHFTAILTVTIGHTAYLRIQPINDPGVSSRLEGFKKSFAGAIARTISEEAKVPRVEAELLGRGLAGMAPGTASP